jgi:6-phosphogluconolactonase
MLYVINELNNTITGFAYDSADGLLHPIQNISTLPTDFDGSNTTAEIVVHPSGNFLYGSNRGHNSLAAFRIDPNTGLLSSIGHFSTEGETPRHFTIHPSGDWLLAANQNSNEIVTFRVDQTTGELSSTGSVEAPTPVCVLFAPSAQ